MKSRTAFCRLCGLLLCTTTAYGETFHQLRGGNGEWAFTNIPTTPTAPTEVQRAREQAEIEYWRAVEARARSLRMTPDTEVHRKRKSALQEEAQMIPGGPSPRTNRRPAAKKNEERISPDMWHTAALESKKNRSRKTRVRKAKPLTPSNSRAGNIRRAQAALN